MGNQSYQDAIKYLNTKGRRKHLLLGNGFSMSYDTKIFSYNALSNFLFQTNDDLLIKLFKVIKTTNFETIMSQLDIFLKLTKEFTNNEELAEKIKIASDKLKEILIDAISELHPEHVFKIPPDKSTSCASFLNEYLNSEGNVFTTNYDLLLYWVLMCNQEKINNIVDGFGREYIEKDEYEKDFIPEFGELTWGPNKATQHIFYLHGALHIFDTGISIIKEIYDIDFLLTNIKKRIEGKEYPVFVTAGDGNQKLEHILHNQYLDYCYKQLSSITGSLVTFGFSFGEYDHHVIEAINRAARQSKDNRLWSVYIGVYSDADEKHIKSTSKMFKCKVKMFDAKTLNVWNN